MPLVHETNLTIRPTRRTGFNKGSRKSLRRCIFSLLLIFPPVPESIVVFGAGYRWDALAQARWLDRCAMHYWGDIDTHGFAILNQLRRHFHAVSSILMDRLTFDAYADSWGVEASPLTADLQRLTFEEGRLYDDLRHQRLRPGVYLRLEQEHIGYVAVKRALRQIIV
ncbi:DUF2220 domain-containing protein [Robbsia andropogonis]|uniref:DUF2220 domain-containing protein n=1 Tax=Robbsia andropogonis TaxID=28092 RepID=UPI0009E3EF86|nr:DUF2220 domain-containing protein [Robbsia andropogonis]